MINEARFGVRYNELNEFDPWENPNQAIADKAKEFLLQGSQDFPAVFNNNPGAAGFTAGLFGTGNGNSPYNNGDYNGNKTPLYSFGDTLSWTRGTHAFKFGGEVRRTKTTGYNGIPQRTDPGNFRWRRSEYGQQYRADSGNNGAAAWACHGRYYTCTDCGS
jgi:hypothetical protein